MTREEKMQKLRLLEEAQAQSGAAIPQEDDRAAKMAKLAQLEEAQRLSAQSNFGERGPKDYGEHFKRTAGLAGRVVAGLPGDILDIPLGIENLRKWGTSKISGGTPEYYPSAGEKIRKELYDPLTKHKFVPQGKGEEWLSEIGGALLPMGPLSAAGKAISKGAPRVGKFIQGVFKPSAANLTGTATGVVGARTLAELDPESAAAPLVGGLLGGTLGNVAGHTAAGAARAVAQNAKKIGSGLANMRTNAIVRDMGLGKKVEELIPYYYGAADQPHISMGETGKKIGTAATRERAKRKEYFKKEYGDIESEFGKQAKPEQRMVSVKEATDWIRDHMVSSGASKDVATRKNFMNGPYGKWLADLLGVDKKRISSQELAHLVQKSPESFSRSMDIDALVNLRRNLDSSIKTNEWKHVGGDKEGLTAFRGVLENMRENAVKNVSPELHGKLKKTNAEYKSYLDTYAPALNRIKDAENHAGKTYKAATTDLNTTGEDLTRVFDMLDPKDKAQFANRIVEDFTRTPNGPSSRQFKNKIGDLQEEARDILYSHTPNAPYLKRMENAQKGLEKLQSQRLEEPLKDVKIFGISTTPIPKAIRYLTTVGADNPASLEKAILRSEKVGSQPHMGKDWKKRAATSEPMSRTESMLQYLTRNALTGLS